MRKPATSLALAIANVVLLGLGYLDNWKHVLSSEHLPPKISLALGVISVVVIPFLVLLTVGFAIRDFVRVNTRWEAVLALFLSVPIGILYALTSF
jgi:hypothetical protein